MLTCHAQQIAHPTGLAATSVPQRCRSAPFRSLTVPDTRKRAAFVPDRTLTQPTCAQFSQDASPQPLQQKTAAHCSGDAAEASRAASSAAQQPDPALHVQLMTRRRHCQRSSSRHSRRACRPIGSREANQRRLELAGAGDSRGRRSAKVGPLRF